jgi:hypothetical protein
MPLRRRKPTTRSPFLTSHRTDYRTSRRERLAFLVELLAVIFVPLLVLALLLGVALVVQAVWSPLAGGVAALVVLALVSIYFRWWPLA